MGIFEIISAIVLIIACVLIVVVVLMQDTKTQMSKSISGTSSTDNFFSKNAGRTKEAMLTKLTTVAAIVFFVLALAVNVINVYFGASSDVTDDSSSVVSDVLDLETESEAADDTTSGAEDTTSTDSAADTTTSAESSAPAEESTATE